MVTKGQKWTLLTIMLSSINSPMVYKISIQTSCILIMNKVAIIKKNIYLNIYIILSHLYHIYWFVWLLFMQCVTILRCIWYPMLAPMCSSYDIWWRIPVCKMYWKISSTCAVVYSACVALILGFNLLLYVMHQFKLVARENMCTEKFLASILSMPGWVRFSTIISQLVYATSLSRIKSQKSSNNFLSWSPPSTYCRNIGCCFAQHLKLGQKS